MYPVLVIDDNEAVCTALSVLFDVHGIPCVTANSPEQGLAILRDRFCGVVIQDMNFSEDSTSGEEGIRLFHHLRAADPFVPILLITAWTSLASAVQLVKEGAHDYLGKPWDDDKLIQEVRSLLKLRQRQCPEESAHASDSGELIYADPAMHRLVSMALRVAPADVPVLITGPNGSGKEMLAQLIQAHSKRAGEPFVKVNAGGLPNELLESELFGAEPGAFTGARARRIGRFEEANGGTLFLDEIGNLSAQGQMKLLRVLQSGEFSRLGSNRIMTTDVRVISATNADLPAAITAGDFREDLYFRLNVVELILPALAERPADILPLVRYFLDKYSAGKAPSLSVAAEQALSTWHWPGNVRELSNRIQRAVLVTQGTIIGPSDLGLAQPGGVQSATTTGNLEDATVIRSALEEAHGNVSRAAAAIGISRQAFYRRMDKHGIVWERRPQH